MERKFLTHNKKKELKRKFKEFRRITYATGKEVEKMSRNLSIAGESIARVFYPKIQPERNIIRGRFEITW